MLTVTRVMALAAMSLPALLLQPAVAQLYPTQPIRMVVPYPPGGPTDALARILASEMQVTLGQPVIVENKPGASGAIGTREVARAAPDGYTITLTTNQTHATNKFLLKEPGYDPQKDFVPIAGVADLQHVLVVSKGLAANKVKDLVALAKAQPGKLNCGSTGLGSASHLTLALFQSRTKTEMAHIPFRGAAPMALEIVAGRIDCAFATLPSVLGQIEGGEMRGLAIASNQHAPQLPSLPLLKEEGVADSESDAWLAMFAPAATPPLIVERLGRTVAYALEKPAVNANATKLGIAVNIRDGKAFATYLDAEIKKWAAIVEFAGLKPE
jgi:tripartite-type tricarboxylate transporter receptor subunit TctC